MISKNALILLFLIPIVSSCYRNAGICTKELAMATVEVVNQDGDPVELDSTQTRKSNGDILLTTFESEFEDEYAVATDSERFQLSKKGTQLTFKGWKNGDELFSEEFNIGRDDCHIQINSGTERIVVF